MCAGVTSEQYKFGGSSCATLEATITRPGVVTSGAWANTDTGATASISASNGSTPLWLAAVGSSMDQGTYTMNLTVESSSTVSSGDVYIATGCINATLQPVTATGATGTVTFSASF